MKALIFICLFQFTSILIAQDYYEKARNSFGDNELDSARYYIDLNLSRKPTTQDYFLSGMSWAWAPPLEGSPEGIPSQSAYGCPEPRFSWRVNGEGTFRGIDVGRIYPRESLQLKEKL